MADVTLTPADFKLFAVEDFAPRMESLKTILRPRLTAIATRLVDSVSEITGHAMYVHVARHARRTVNPPPETWAAFASAARGYKVLPHFALCVSRAGIGARVVLKDEAIHARNRLATSLPRKAKALSVTLSAAGVQDYDRWDHVHRPTDALTAESLRTVASRAALKTGHVDLGVGFDRWPGDAAVLAAFKSLLPVYALAHKK